MFPTFAVGGAQTRFAALANHLGDRAWHVIVSLDRRTDAREKLDPGLRVTYPVLPQARGPAGGARVAYAFLRKARADRLVTSNWGAMDWAIANTFVGLKHLHTEDGFGPEEQDRQLPRRIWTRRLVLRGSDVALPSRTLQRIARDSWRLPASRLHYIPNGIDVARFAAAEGMPAACLEALGGGKVIGTIAALRPEKNLARLIGAFAKLRLSQRIVLVIVGDGPERQALAFLAARLGVAAHVLFAGHSREPERWMASFDVFALSSDTEQMPLSVLEAMAAGLPVVSTDVGDVQLMVASENLPLIVARDEDALAAGLSRALTTNAGLANQFRARAEYDQAAMFARYEALLGMA